MTNLFKLFNIMIIFSGLLLCNNAYAIKFPDKPGDSTFIIDNAGLIDTKTSTQINLLASKLLQEEQVALFVVTITYLFDYDAAEYSIERYASALFNEWEIGSDERNYGMLFLISKGNRKARIELGADWDGSYNQTTQEIMDTLIIPSFKRKDFSLGIISGVKGLDAMARGLNLPKAKAPWYVIPRMIVSILLVIALIYNLFRTGRSGWAWALIAFVGVVLFTILRPRGRSRGGGFGGGYSGGGGFSGGGGASGSW